MCSTITTASAPRGSMPPVAIIVARPGDHRRRGAMPGASTSSFERHACAAPLPSRRSVSARLQREAVDVRAVEAGHVDSRDDVLGEHAIRALRASGTVSRPSGARLRWRSEARRRLVARDDVRNCVCRRSALRALHRRDGRHAVAVSVVEVDGDRRCPGRSLRSRRARSTKPSARVVDDRIDAPLNASGSTSLVDQTRRGSSRRARSPETILRATMPRRVRCGQSADAPAAQPDARARRRNRTRTGTTPDCRAAGTPARRRCDRTPAGLDGRIATPWIASSPDFGEQPRRVILAADARAAGYEDRRRRPARRSASRMRAGIVAECADAPRARRRRARRAPRSIAELAS